MRKIWLFTLTLFAVLLVQGQTVQKGKVVLQHSKGKGLPEVQVTALNAVPTQSGVKGEFQLNYSGTLPGDWAGVKEIYKRGYDLVNEEEVQNWILSPHRELIVVMCPSDKLQENKEKYYLMGKSHYEKMYKETLAQLEDLRVQNKISAEQYWNDIQKAGQEIDRALTHLEKMADKLALINEDDLNKEEKKAWRLLDDGRFDEALKLFEKERLKNDLQTMIPSVKRYTDILMFAGGEDNIKKAGANLEQIAAITPDSYDSQMEYAKYLKIAVDYPNAILSLENALRIATNDLQRAKVYRELGEIYNYVPDYDKAEDYQTKSFELHQNLAETYSPVYYLNCAENLNYLGNLYYLRYQFDDGIEVLNKGLKLLDQSGVDNISYEYLYQKASLQGTLGAISYLKLLWTREGDKDFVERNLSESLDIWEQLAEINPHDINKIVTSMASNLANFYMSMGDDSEKAEEYFLWAIEQQEEIDKKYPYTVKNALALMYRSLGSFYSVRGKHDLAEQYLSRAVIASDEIMKINAESFVATQIGNYIVYSDAASKMGDPERGLVLAQKAVELVKPWMETNPQAFIVPMINSHVALIGAYSNLLDFKSAVRGIQPIRHLIEDETIFNAYKNIIKGGLNFVHAINLAGVIAEEDQDDDIKEIFRFVAKYYNEE